jgi:hypothetical protein
MLRDEMTRGQFSTKSLHFFNFSNTSNCTMNLRLALRLIEMGTSNLPGNEARSGRKAHIKSL